MRKIVKLMMATGIVPLGLLIISCSQGFSSPDKTSVTPELPTALPSAATAQTKVADGGTTGELLVQGRKTQSHEANAVTIEATPEGKLAPGSKELVFEVVMDTHSVNLDVYDLKNLAVLRNSQSGEFKATSWQAPGGGHHRSGVLTFSSEQQLLQPDTKYIELFIRDVASIPHTLRWELRQAAS